MDLPAEVRGRGLISDRRGAAALLIAKLLHRFHDRLGAEAGRFGQLLLIAGWLLTIIGNVNRLPIYLPLSLLCGGFQGGDHLVEPVDQFRSRFRREAAIRAGAVPSRIGSG